MAFIILNPDATGKRKAVHLPHKQAARFKAIKEGRAIPTAWEKEKADKIAKIYLGHYHVSPYSEPREHPYPIPVRLPYKES